MAKVGIVMGSDSDMPIMSKAAAILDKLGIDYEMKIISAHREPDIFFEYAKSAEAIMNEVQISYRDLLEVIYSLTEAGLIKETFRNNYVRI